MYIIDFMTNPCIQKNNNYNFVDQWFIYIYLYMHHLLASILYFGFLFRSKEYLMMYLILLLVTMIHWQTNNERCVLTEVLNYICKNDREQSFRDIFYWLGIKESKYGNMIIYIYLAIFMFITIIRLISDKRKSINKFYEE